MIAPGANVRVRFMVPGKGEVLMPAKVVYTNRRQVGVEFEDGGRMAVDRGDIRA